MIYNESALEIAQKYCNNFILNKQYPTKLPVLPTEGTRHLYDDKIFLHTFEFSGGMFDTANCDVKMKGDIVSSTNVYMVYD